VLIVSDEEAGRLLSAREALPIVEAALHALGTEQAVSPPRWNLATRTDGNREHVLKVWGATLPEAGVSAVRITSAVYETHRTGERAVGDAVAAAPGGGHVGLILVFDVATSEPLGMVHDATVNRLGHCVAAGIAVKHVARPDSAVVGVLGAGAQARLQVESIATVRRIRELRVFSPRTKDAERFAAELRMALDLPLVTTVERREAVAGCDLVVVATSAPAAVFEADWVGPGTHVNLSRPSEAPAELFERASALVSIGSDPAATWATRGAGEIWRAREPLHARSGRAIGLADLVCGARAGRSAADEVTLFGALAGQCPGIVFAALGGEVLRRAHRAGAGRVVPTDWLTQSRPS
jgi:ornithine cyclodeaminase/alanine dehydrogenase-like protein (mu-crystallin family)